jgi:hypothetical protein
MPIYRGLCEATLPRPRRITTDLQFSDRPSQHNLIPLSMQDLHSLEYFPFGILFARERATRTALSACQPTWDFAGLGYFPHVHIALPLTYSSWIGHYSTILPSHIQNLDSLEYLSFGVLQVSCSLVNELPARLPAHANLPGALPGYFPLVHGALLLISSSRMGHHSTISYRYACKTLIRMNISALVSCSLVHELPKRIPAHVNLPATLPGYFPHVHGALLSTHSSRIGHYSTISYRYISLHTVT